MFSQIAILCAIPPARPTAADRPKAHRMATWDKFVFFIIFKFKFYLLVCFSFYFYSFLFISMCLALLSFYCFFDCLSPEGPSDLICPAFFARPNKKKLETVVLVFLIQFMLHSKSSPQQCIIYSDVAARVASGAPSPKAWQPMGMRISRLKTEPRWTSLSMKYSMLKRAQSHYLNVNGQAA